jgi:hypothetical protein
MGSIAEDFIKDKKHKKDNAPPYSHGSSGSFFGK